MGRRSWTVSSPRHGPQFSADTQSESPRWRQPTRHSHYARSAVAHYPRSSTTSRISHQLRTWSYAIARCARGVGMPSEPHTRPQFGALRGALPSLPDGSPSLALCLWPPAFKRCSPGVACPCPRMSWRTENTAAVWRRKCTFLPSSWSGAGASGGHRGDQCSGFYPALWRVSTRRVSTRTVVSDHRGLTEGFDSTPSESADARGGRGPLPAPRPQPTPEETPASASPVRQSLRTQCHLVVPGTAAQELAGLCAGQRLRHHDHVAHKAGRANGERVRRWFQDKKTGWYVGLADPQLPATRTLLDQAHNASERKLFARKGFSPSRWQSPGVSDEARAAV